MSTQAPIKVRRGVTVLMLLAFVGTGAWWGGDLWRLATTRVVYQIQPGYVKQTTVHRWREEEGKPEVLRVQLWDDAGYMRSDVHHTKHRMTVWGADGTVKTQREGGRSVAPPRGMRGPPWRWGVQDQRAPTAPWVLEGMTQWEWWNSLPEESK